MHKALILAVACAALALGALSGCKKDDPAGDGGVSDDAVKLGLFVSTTGQIADFGIATRRGAEIAIEEINAAGGVNGKKIDLVFYDIASKQEDTKNAATKLTTQDRVLVGMGAVASSLSQTAAPTFQSAGIPMVSPSSTFPPVTEKGDLIFRICFTDEFAGAALALFAHNDLGKRRAAVLANQDDPYSTGLANFFESRFKQLGGSIVSSERFSNNATDFRTQIDNINAADPKPDLIFAPVYYNDIILIAQQVRDRGLSIPLLGSDGWESPTLLKNAAAVLDGSYFGNHYSPNDPDERVQGFIGKYKELHGDTPTSLAALGYDVVYFVKSAIDRAGSFDRGEVADAMRSTKGFHGVTGTFDIDAKRNAAKPITLLKISSGKLELVKQVSPDDVK